MAPINPVVGTDLFIHRAGRQLLGIPQIALGSYPCTTVVGPNGAGKSLLIKTLSGLLIPDSGSVTWAGTPPDSARRHKVGLLLQRPILLKRSALENVIYPLLIAGHTKSVAVALATSAMNEAGLGALVDIFAPQLSGGEQQRLALARALVLKPDMLFLDEATANVDAVSTLSIEQQLQRAMSEGLRVVMVSHDMGQVKRLADEVILMHNGAVIEQNARQQFFDHTTNNPVSRRWLAGELLV